MSVLSQSFADTDIIARLWLKRLPGAKSRLVLLAAIPLVWMALNLATRAGPEILRAARQGTGDMVGRFTANYVVALQDGDLGALGMSIVAAVAVSSFITPFTSGGSISLIPETDLLGVRPSRLHAYFMSLMTTAVSIIGLFQMLALTIFASLLAIDGDPFAPTIVAWLSWVPLLALTVAQAWLTELLLRSVSRRRRVLLLSVTVATVGIVLVMSEDARAAIGRASNEYAALLRRLSTADGSFFAVTVGALLALTLTLMLIGLWLCQAAQQKPVHVGTRRSDLLVRLPPLSNGHLMLFQVTLAQVLRNRETRRPMIVILTVNLLGAWFIASTQQSLSALLTIPIALGASWAANIFGLMGPGMTWMASQPGLLRAMPTAAFPAQALLTFLLVNVIWVVVAARHGMTLHRWVGLEFATIAVIALMTRAAYTHSVKHADLVRLGGRGDTAVKPGQAISYTFRTTPIAGLVASGILALDNLIVAFAVTVGVLAWEMVRWSITDRRWADSRTRADVVRRVASA